jgi:hypothetical protein
MRVEVAPRRMVNSGNPLPWQLSLVREWCAVTVSGADRRWLRGARGSSWRLRRTRPATSTLIPRVELFCDRTALLRADFDKPGQRVGWSPVSAASSMACRWRWR